MLPGPGPVLCMICERHVILKAALHSRIAVVSYIIMLYCLVYTFSYNFLMLVWGTYNYSYSYLASFPNSCIVHNYDTMIIQV